MRGQVVPVVVLLLTIIGLMFVLGFAANWKTPAKTDIFGMGEFFSAATMTVEQFVFVISTAVWAALFFITEGVFVFAYYKMGKFLLGGKTNQQTGEKTTTMSELMSWFERAKSWMSRF